MDSCLRYLAQTVWLFVSEGEKREETELLALDPYERLASNFSAQYHHWIKHLGHENIGCDHQRKLLIVKPILLVSTMGNVKKQYREYAYWCEGVMG